MFLLIFMKQKMYFKNYNSDDLFLQTLVCAVIMESLYMIIFLCFTSSFSQVYSFYFPASISYSPLPHPSHIQTSVLSQCQVTNIMSYLARQMTDMASYVAVTGTPADGHTTVFGLTPQELAYLKVRKSNTQ